MGSGFVGVLAVEALTCFGPRVLSPFAPCVREFFLSGFGVTFPLVTLSCQDADLVTHSIY